MNQLAPTALEPATRKARKPKWRNRSWWMRQLHTWHYMSAAVSLIGMLLFAVTGITLNHAASIGATPSVTNRHGTLHAPLLAELKGSPADAPLPPAVAADVRKMTGLDTRGRAGEWSDNEVYVALPRPGGDAWVSIDRTSGKVTAERTDQGWISYLNDLHKGRNAGAAWGWLIDVFAIACITFTLTGLMLLQFLARGRPLTWPLVGAGLVVPVLLAILFIH